MAEVISREDAAFYLQFLFNAATRESVIPASLEVGLRRLCERLGSEHPWTLRGDAADAMRRSRLDAKQCRSMGRIAIMAPGTPRESGHTWDQAFDRAALYWAIAVRVLARVRVAVIEDEWGIDGTSEEGWLVGWHCSEWPFSGKDVVFRYYVGPGGREAARAAVPAQLAQIRREGAASVEAVEVLRERDTDLRMRAFHDTQGLPCVFVEDIVVCEGPDDIYVRWCTTHGEYEESPGFCPERMIWLEQRAAELDRLGPMVPPETGKRWLWEPDARCAS